MTKTGGLSRVFLGLGGFNVGWGWRALWLEGLSSFRVSERSGKEALFRLR